MLDGEKTWGDEREENVILQCYVYLDILIERKKLKI